MSGKNADALAPRHKASAIVRLGDCLNQNLAIFAKLAEPRRNIGDMLRPFPGIILLLSRRRNRKKYLWRDLDESRS